MCESVLASRPRFLVEFSRSFRAFFYPPFQTQLRPQAFSIPDLSPVDGAGPLAAMGQERDVARAGYIWKSHPEHTRF